LALKDYKSVQFFERAQIDPTNKWVGMYDVDYETKDYGNAIKTIEKLILLTLNSKKT
jgi:hypothetical protein